MGVDQYAEQLKAPNAKAKRRRRFASGTRLLVLMTLPQARASSEREVRVSQDTAFIVVILLSNLGSESKNIGDSTSFDTRSTLSLPAANWTSSFDDLQAPYPPLPSSISLPCNRQTRSNSLIAPHLTNQPQQLPCRNPATTSLSCRLNNTITTAGPFIPPTQTLFELHTLSQTEPSSRSI